MFELSPQGDHLWKEKVLHTFDGGDGVAPQASLIFDTEGNLYGTTLGATVGGTGHAGTVFKLTPASDGPWKETVMHYFRPAHYFSPISKLSFDAAGNLYGTVTYGGSHHLGTVFEIEP